VPNGEVLIGPDAPRCGDGRVNPGEACDDANTEGADGCSADCTQVEKGFACRVKAGACEHIRFCGDGRQTSDEQCDDGNSDPGDGCSESCLREKNFACPKPGEACVSTVTCGDSALTGSETCDDGNVDADDGCDAKCVTEQGWTCPNLGAPCRETCGDGLVVGNEACDDGNQDDADGCSASCSLERGWVCDEPGDACRKAVCGDEIVEGSEPCDDGDNLIVGDGCSPGCTLEPSCKDGVCFSKCGDGLSLAGDDEECDDGNSVGGDGCSATCKLEKGWTCEVPMPDPPKELTLPILYRDFIHKPADARHPDFESYSGDATTPGLVENELGPDGKPVYTGICELGGSFTAAECPFEEQTTSKKDFDEWYRDADTNIPYLDSLTFTPQTDGTFMFESAGDGLFPLNDKGWVALGKEETSAEAHYNYGFTSELRHWFEFTGGEFLEFSGDDDVWVFIGGHLVVDIGGLHKRTLGNVTLDDAAAEKFGLEKGRVYEIALFHAERHTYESNFRLTLKGFNPSTTECKTTCGDGVAAGDEACDDGKKNGEGYGHCSKNCELGPRCGDGVVDPDNEKCDNGLNVDAYDTGKDTCAPGCVRPPYCGDGMLDAEFGEECDGEENDGKYGGCNKDCTLAPHCGDHIVNGDEECDDGNQQNDDSCDTECKTLGFGPAR
jgi:fibro-slime domain-containing protein